MEQREPGFRWDFAVTSKINLVFPSKNLGNYWKKEKNTEHIIVPFPHYFFHKWKSFIDFISFVENHGTEMPEQRKVAAGRITGL